MHTTGHIVLITGGAAGIGRALALRFAQAGNQVIVVGRDAQKLAELKALQPTISTIQADLAQASERQHLADQVPALSILINNAGVQYHGDLVEQQSAQVDRDQEIAINLTAPIDLIQRFLPKLQQQPEAAIINVSSGLALVPKQQAPIYCATKAGIHIFTKALRWQLEQTQVRVFEIIPPLVDTAMTAGRGKGKISPEALVEEFWRGFSRDRYQLAIGQVKLLIQLQRFLPRVADRLMRYGR
ncbi:SDR family oxidoreductase [Herpetosiphon geysericola]|uniref:Oxidoreductase n=1 Tax=Herpetosiphon geysericola TaxID=70996 RepID=A0A0N8GR78_9CHLR|nr:SDR family oxidoreductase [Herpetosiphon geysericola]KPL85738.1 oxidoreductase [Herpetosiphon geysericola]